MLITAQQKEVPTLAANIQTSFKRYEKKYLLTPEQQEAVLFGVRRYMKADTHGKYSINNIYYDTQNWNLIRTSIEKPDYKEKLRVRSYGTPGDQDPVFVEIKKKVEGIVYKRRITMPAAQAPRYLAGNTDLSPGGQISREIDYFQKHHRAFPRIFIGYDRTALAGIEMPDLRITFDTNIRFRTVDLDLRAGSGGMSILPPERILMEIKIPGAAPLWLSHLLSRHRIFPMSFSKYGTCFRDYILPEISTKEMSFIA